MMETLIHEHVIMLNDLSVMEVVLVKYILDMHYL